MSNLDLLKAIRSLIGGLRGVGNTSLMRRGTDNYDREFFVISHSREYSEELLRGSKYGKAKTLYDINSLQGYSVPVVIDHHVLASSIANAINDIEKKNEHISQMNITIDKLMTITEYYQDRSHNIEDLALKLVLCRWWQFSKKKRLRNELLNKIMNYTQSPSIEELFGGLEGLLSKK